MDCPCDEVFEGETAMEVAEKCGMHIMSTTDEGHKPMRDMMTKGIKFSEEEKYEDQKKWFEWFNKEWDKKEEA